MKGKKFREIRNALVMVIVMVAMMSSATFAWFTITNSPTVTGLQMTAASSAGLLVSNTSNTNDFTNAIVVATDNGDVDTPQEVLTLSPVTPDQAVINQQATIGFREAKYTGGTITGLKDKLLVGDDLKEKVAVYTYYLKAESGTVNVGIITGNATENTTTALSADNGVASLSGTFIRQKDGSTDTASEYANYAVRIGLVLDDSQDVAKMKILEPNCTSKKLTSGMTQAPTDQNATLKNSNFDVDVRFTDIGDIVDVNNSSLGTNISDTLFTVGTTPVKVTMYVWLEGNDEECVDQIKADNIEGQIQFTVVDDVTP